MLHPRLDGTAHPHYLHFRGRRQHLQYIDLGGHVHQLRKKRWGEVWLPAGHWQQTVATGAARQITYLDALWRPVVSESFDSTSSATTSATARDGHSMTRRTAQCSSLMRWRA